MDLMEVKLRLSSELALIVLILSEDPCVFNRYNKFVFKPSLHLFLALTCVTFNFTITQFKDNIKSTLLERLTVPIQPDPLCIKTVHLAIIMPVEIILKPIGWEEEWLLISV